MYENKAQVKPVDGKHAGIMIKLVWTGTRYELSKIELHPTDISKHRTERARYRTQARALRAYKRLLALTGAEEVSADIREKE